MKVDLFDFDLPGDCIATRPVTPRDAARLLCVGGEGGQETDPALSGVPSKNQQIFWGRIKDKHIYDLPDLLQPNDLLVLNNAKVIPARLFGKRGEAKIEVTLHKQLHENNEASRPSESSAAPHASDSMSRSGGNQWQAFAKPAKKLRVGDRFEVAPDFTATVQEKLESGEVVLRFDDAGTAFMEKLARYGTMPLPPYMKREADAEDERNYQTVFAKEQGAVAAPTAGLHFTPKLLDTLKAKGIETVEVTLHVGAGTFLPVKVDDTNDHVMHSEWVQVSSEAAACINAAKRAGRRIVAVGTTAMRTLESVTDESGTVHPFAGETDIFITPGYRFRCVDVLLTNFHLPRSTLFMLVSAFAGLDTMKAAYTHAIDTGYRFYSYGDACLLEKAL